MKRKLDDPDARFRGLHNKATCLLCGMNYERGTHVGRAWPDAVAGKWHHFVEKTQPRLHRKYTPANQGEVWEDCLCDWGADHGADEK